MKLGIQIIGVVAIWLCCALIGHCQENATPATSKQSQDGGTESKSGDQPEWRVISPSGSNVELEYPNKPRYIERKFTPVEGQPPIKVRIYLTSIDEGRAAFVFSYHDLHETPTTKAEIDAVLSGAIQGSIVNVGGREVAQNHIPNSKYPGRSFVYLYAQKQKIYQVAARVVLVGNRQYQVSALMEREGYDVDMAARFLDSLKILDAAYDLPPKPLEKLEVPVKE